MLPLEDELCFILFKLQDKGLSAKKCTKQKWEILILQVRQNSYWRTQLEQEARPEMGEGAAQRILNSPILMGLRQTLFSVWLVRMTSLTGPSFALIRLNILRPP